MSSPSRTIARLTRASLAVALVTCLAPAHALGAPGDVYVAQLSGAGDGTVFRVGPAGGEATAVVAAPPPGFNPSTLAFTRSGTLLAADKGPTPGVWEIDPRTGSVTSFLGAPPLADPQDAIVSRDGSVLLSDSASGPGGTPAVLRVDPATKAITPVASGLPLSPVVRGLAEKRDGTILAAGIDRVFEISPAGMVRELAPADEALSGASGVALTPDEAALFVAAFDSTPNQILRVDPVTGAFAQFAPFTDVMDVELLPDRSLLASDDAAGRVYRVGAAGGEPTVFSDDSDLSTGELGGIAVEPERCAGRMPTLVGTTGKDVLTGSDFPEVISALGGADVIRAVGGDDVICGGSGGDRLFGSAGRDRLLGGPGKDRLVGGPSKDRLIGGRGRDLLSGGGGKDVCKGGPARDRERSC